MDRGTWRVIVLGGIRSRIQLSMHMHAAHACVHVHKHRDTLKKILKKRGLVLVKTMPKTQRLFFFLAHIHGIYI